MCPFDQETTRRQPGGTPRPEETPHLLGIAGELAGRIFPLEGLREVFIGRSPDCEIELVVDQPVSRRHARVSLDDTGRAWLEDLGSLNGTSVNGAFVTRPTLLSRGDRIFVGEGSILKLDWLTTEEVARWQRASVDPLTECMNRGTFNSRLNDLCVLAGSRGRPLALILMDVDRFKQFNDEYGHQAGDFVLQRVAAAIKSVLADVPGNPPVHRYGGEEFAVLLPDADTDVAAAAVVAERIRAAVEATPLIYEDLRLSVTLSAGVAETEGGPEAPALLIKAADERLYRAKREGRNRVVS